MVRYLKTIVDNVSETGDFDPLADDTTREYSFVSFIPISQIELDWVIRVYQIHYGHHQHESKGTDDGRDKSVTFMPSTAPLLLSRLVVMTEFLDYYNERMIRDKLVTEIVKRIQTYRPIQTTERGPIKTIVDVVFEAEVNRRKNITTEMHGLTQNLDLVDKILRHAWPTLGPLISSCQTRSMFITNHGLYMCHYNKWEAYIRPLEKPGEFHRIELDGVLSIACGLNHSMILTRDGLFGFGDGEYGQLGLGRATVAREPVSIPIDEARHVSCGLFHTMILTREHLFACGSNKKGQLGVASFTSMMREPKAMYPVRVEIKNVLSVTCGAEYTMVLTNDGLFGCGDNSKGQLGLGDTKDRQELTRIPIENVLSVACGVNHTFILTSDGILFVCGDNSYGQLGLGDTETRMSPTRSAMVNVISFSLGTNHSIILTEGDSLYVCGDNQYGQLGLGPTHTNDATPTLLQLKGVLSLACGGNQSFVVTQDNVFAFGSNEYGQLGLMDTVSQPIPRPIPLLVGYEYDVRRRVMSPVTERHDKRHRFDASLCTRCNKRASFTEPFQKRYLFCGDSCYTRYFTASRCTQ